MSDDKINEIKQRLKDQFSRDEVDQFINIGKKMAGKAVLHAIIAVLEEGPARGRGDCARIVKKVRDRIPFNYCGFLQCSFAEIPHLLNVSLSIVDRAYKTDIDIPHAGYATDLFAKYDYLKQIAIAYWRQFAEEHADVYKQICEYRADIDFTNLVIDPANPTTMYFDPACARRVGIFCYYVDANGQPFYKRGGPTPPTPPH